MNDAQVDELLQPFGEQVPGNAQVPVEALEPSDTTEEVSQDQERPAVPDSGQRGGDGTSSVGGASGTAGP